MSHFKAEMHLIRYWLGFCSRFIIIIIIIICTGWPKK